MGVDTDLSVVALIISLIALGVTAIQLLQQLFGTAEGFRQCQDSVISLWSREVRWHWRWSELRFETKYMTPHFTLKEIRTRHDAETHEIAYYNPPYWYRMLEGIKAMKFRAPVIFQKTEKLDLNEKQEGLPAFPSPPPPQMNHQSSAETRVAVVGNANSRAATRIPSKVAPEYFFENADLVDWLHMLHELHVWSDVALLPDQEDKTSYHRPVLAWSGDNESHLSVPAIIPRVHSWDLVPPDVVRPLAKSTVGDIVVLAGRMRLHWTVLDPSSGNMRAEGDHRSLTSTDIRGMGIVLSFNCMKSELPNQDPAIIPSVECDKLRCGIIPRSEAMVPLVPKADCVSNDKREKKWKELVTAYATKYYALATTKHDMAGIASMLEHIGATREAQDLLLNKATRDKFKGISDRSRRDEDLLPGFCDVFTMLTPFMPLKGSRIVKIDAPVHEDFMSPCTRRPGHIVFHRYLTFLVAEKGDQMHPQTKWVYDQLNRASKHFPWTFYSNPEIDRNLIPGTREVPFVNRLREIHHGTTRYFRDLHEKTMNGPHRFKFLDLVASHASVAAVTVRNQGKNKDQPAPITVPDSIRVKRVSFGGDSKSRFSCPPISQKILDRSLLYISMLPSIVDLMLQKGEEDLRNNPKPHPESHSSSSENGSPAKMMLREDLEAAWWTLMLRSFVWEMSVYIQYPVYEARKPVPSEFYYSKVPVWLT